MQRKISPNAGAKKGVIPWNKGLTKDSDRRVLKGAESLSISKIGRPGRLWTDKERKQRSIWAKTQGNGGYKRGSGRGKSGRYKGFWCDSSWELAYVIYCLDHKIDIKRNTEKRSYIFEDQIKSYTPDFIVDSKLVEIKGWITPQWEAKLSQNPDIIVLYEKEMRPILDYVTTNYGKQFINLYD